LKLWHISKEEFNMAYFKVGTVKCDRQMANAYILYMMAGSLFERARLTNPIIERNLRNQYRELSQAKQERQESFTENMLNQIVGDYTEAFGRMKSDIYVKKQDGCYCFWFRTGFEEIIAAVDSHGRIILDKAYHLSEKKWHRLMPAVLKNSWAGSCHN